MKKKQKKRMFKFLIAVIIILCITLLFLIFLNQEPLNTSKDTFEIALIDKCGPAFGSILHTIRTEGECTLLCKNECESQTLNFKEVNFTTNNNNCNLCSCYCN